MANNTTIISVKPNFNYSSLANGDSYWKTYIGVLNNKYTTAESMKYAFADELCDLGEGLLEGYYGLTKNEEKACIALTIATEKGNWKAAQRLCQYTAMKHASQPGQEFDSSKAQEIVTTTQISRDSALLKTFELCANTGEPQSAYNLAVSYGLLGEEYAEKAAKYYRIAAEGANPDGVGRLARAYAYGFGVKENLDIAAYWLLCRVNGASGSTLDEMSDLASFLCSKLDYLQIDDRGFVSSNKDLIQLAMEAGERTAFSHKAYLTTDPAEKLNYAKQAASMGHAEGYHTCSKLVSEEEQKQVYLKKAAELGEPYAQYQYGCSLMRSDAKEAIYWLEKCVLHGPQQNLMTFIKQAYVALSRLYYEEGNYARALYCWKFADESGNPSFNWNETVNSVFKSFDEQGLLPTSIVEDAIKGRTSSEQNGGCMGIIALTVVLSCAFLLMLG